MTSVPEKEEKLAGRCACGAVTFKAVIERRSFGVCHCRMCRRWSGGVWMGVRSKGKPEIRGPVKIWKSSRIGERASCRECGSAIWHRVRSDRSATLGLGLFDDQSGWKMKRQIFIEEKPDHYEFGNSEAVKLTGWALVWAWLLGRIPN